MEKEKHIKDMSSDAAYYDLENLILSEKKDLPLEQKAAMLWGGLYVASKSSAMSYEDRKSIFGRVMAQMLGLL
ncbi:hypothetical protein [Massilimicrobiota timonensis]|uniref:hypothetical protein n=1 Tax=Massilimicrobiota timonensis TaxID=1776392 RepID=UPI00101CB234|nr:hypothetical protein [Massilimicrobiota timonensis]